MLRWICRMRLQGRACGGAVGFFGRHAKRKRVGEVEADESFGGNLNLLSAGDGVGAGSDTAAGSGSDGCAFASAEDAAKDGSDGCASSDFFSGVLAAALALDAVGFGVDGEFIAVAIDAGEFDGEQGVPFVVGGLLHGDDAAGDGCALAKDDEAVGEDVGGNGAGEDFALLGGGAVEGLGDADGNGGSGRNGDVTECRWWRRWWRRLLHAAAAGVERRRSRVAVFRRVEVGIGERWVQVLTCWRLDLRLGEFWFWCAGLGRREAVGWPRRLPEAGEPARRGY